MVSEREGEGERDGGREGEKGRGKGGRKGWEEGETELLQTTHAQFDFRIPPMCGLLRGLPYMYSDSFVLGVSSVASPFLPVCFPVGQYRVECT